MKVRGELGRKKESVFSGSSFSVDWIERPWMMNMHACRAYRACSTGKDDHPQYVS